MNKKLLLMFVFGIFLFSFASASFTTNTGFSKDTLQGVGASPYYLGLKFTVGSEDMKLIEVAKLSGDDVDTIKLYKSDRTTVLDTQTFSGDTATFSYNLNASTTYYLMVSQLASGGFNIWRDNSVSFPIDSGNGLSIIAGAQESGDDASRAWSKSRLYQSCTTRCVILTFQT